MRVISFMVLAAPRSGTAWATNWLTTEHSLCLHDPLWRHHYQDLDSLPVAPGRLLGMACTGAPLFPEWVNAHPARKVILHRNLNEIDVSLKRIGFAPIGAQWQGKLKAVIGGMHVPWKALFNNPKPIYEFLLQRPFDEPRHRILRELIIERDLEQIEVNPQAARRLTRELAGQEDTPLAH